MGAAVGETLRAQLWDSLQKGTDTMAGVRDPVLVAALPLVRNGQIKTRADFDRFINAYSAPKSAAASPTQEAPVAELPITDAAIDEELAADELREQRWDALTRGSDRIDGARDPVLTAALPLIRNRQIVTRADFDQFVNQYNVHETARIAPQTQEAPAAEPLIDLLAQARDVMDESNPRKGVLLSADNLAAHPDLLNQPEYKRFSKLPLQNDDGTEDLLVGTLREIQKAKAALDAGVPREEVVGRLTRSGAGKPATDNPAVVQQKNADGAVTAETVVDANDPASVQAAKDGYAQEGRTVEVNDSRDTIARRNEGTATPEQMRASREKLKAALAAFKAREAAPIEDDLPDSFFERPAPTQQAAPAAPVVQPEQTPEPQPEPAAPEATPPTDPMTSAQEAPTDYREMDKVQFTDWLNSAPELLDEDLDSQEDRDARAQFFNWLDKAPKQIQRAYTNFELSRYRDTGTDTRPGESDDLMFDEIDDLTDSLLGEEPDSPKIQQLTNDQREQVALRLQARMEAQAEVAPSGNEAEAELIQAGMSEQDFEQAQIIGKHGWIHETKRVRSKAEREKVTDRYAAEGWLGAEGLGKAKKMAANLNQVDPDAVYKVKFYTAAQAKVRGLVVPAGKEGAWFVAMAPKEAADVRYSRAYGAKLTVAGMVRTALSRGLKRWNVLPQKLKDAKPPAPQHGLKFTDATGEVRTIAAREITILGAQLDPNIADLRSANERALRAFFQGIAALYGREGGDLAWRPTDADPMKWLSVDTVIREANGETITLGDALSKGRTSKGEEEFAALRRRRKRLKTQADTLKAEEARIREEIERRMNKRQPGVAQLRAQLSTRVAQLNKIFSELRNTRGPFDALGRERMQARFESAMRSGAPALVANRAAVEQDIRARKASTVAQSVIERIEEQLATMEHETPEYNKLRRRRAKLVRRVEQLTSKIGKVGFDLTEQTKELQRETADEVAAMTGDEIYSPPEEIETALEHQSGDMVLSKTESELQQVERSARGAELIGDNFSKRLNNSAIGTFAPASESSAVVVSPAEQARVGAQLADADAVARAREAERQQAREQRRTTPNEDSESLVVEEANGVDVQLSDPKLSARFAGVVSQMRALLGLTNSITLSDSLVSLVEQANNNGDFEFAAHIGRLYERGEPPRGVHWNNKQGQTYIWLNPDMFRAATTYARAIKTLMHELGHSFYQQTWGSADPQLKQAVEAAFDRFRAANPGKIRQLDSRGNPMSLAGQREEWFADQVAAWVVEDRIPRNLVEQFFYDMAQKLKEAWTAIKKAYPLDQSVGDYIRDSIRRQERSVSPALQSFGVMNDMMFDQDDLLEEPSPWYKQFMNQVRLLVARSPTTEKVLTNVGKSAMALHESLLASLGARIHRMGITAFSSIVKMFYLRPGDVGNFTFDDSVRNRLTNFQREYDRIIGDMDDEQQAELLEELRSEKPIDQMPKEYREVAEQFRQFMRKLYEYQLASGLPIKALADYFPQVADIAELQKPDAVDAIYDAARAAGRGDTRQNIIDLIASMTDDAMIVEIDINSSPVLEGAEGNIRTPFAQALRSRQMDPKLRAIIRNIKDEKGRSRFYDKNLKSVVRRYMWQAVRRSEFNKILGDTYWLSEKGKAEQATYDPYRQLNALLADARKQGVDNDQVKLMLDALSAFMGQYNRLTSDPLRKLTRSVAFYQNLRTLMLVTLSSLGEFTLLFLRPGNFGQSWESIKSNYEDAWKKGGETSKRLRILGHAVDEMDAFGFDDFRLARDYNSKLDRAHEAFFRVVGLTKWTNWMRGLSLRVSEDYLDMHMARVLNDQGQDGDSKRRLDELGLSAQDVKTWVENRKALYGDKETTHEDLARKNSPYTKEQLDSIRNVTGALARMVNEMVIHPNAAMKPLWRSDERFMLVGQLGSYTYGFLNQVLGRVWHELTRDGATTMQKAMPLIALAMMVPIVALGVELRELAQYELWGKEAPTDKMDGFKYLRTIIGRTGALGLTQLGVDAYDAGSHGRAPMLALLGPTISQVNAAFQDVASADRVGRQLWKTTLQGTPVVGSFPGIRDALLPE